LNEAVFLSQQRHNPSILRLLLLLLLLLLLRRRRWLFDGWGQASRQRRLL
jgi:hypothetical protein